MSSLSSWKDWFSAAILKGNKGIGDHLALLPGVNLEVRDDKGRTILLGMLEDHGEQFTEAKVKEVKAFIEKHKGSRQWLIQSTTITRF